MSLRVDRYDTSPRTGTTTGAMRPAPGAPISSSLADVLERVLDKGIVIAGDISIAIADVELLRIRIRLLIASVDKAQEIGINWWQSDPTLSSRARDLEMENKQLTERLERLEHQLARLPAAQSAETPQRDEHTEVKPASPRPRKRTSKSGNGATT